MNHQSTRSSSRIGALRQRVLRGGVVTLLGVVLAGSAVGLAAPAAADDATGGWVRLAHLSPDTPSVDVALTAFDDSSSMLALSDVAYGDVSDYTRVPAGTYVATMTPAGGDADSTPAITQSVTVTDGRAYTVAAVGENAELTGTVLEDDLTPPTEGTAKIRLLQASVSAPEVTVRALGGPVLAEEAQFATATGYAEIGPGVWSVELEPTEGDAESVVTAVSVAPGTVNTIIVLDGQDGGLMVRTAVDAASSPVVPDGGVETGGGSTATSLTPAGVSAAPLSVGPDARLPVFAGAALFVLAGLSLVRRPLGGRAR